VKRYIRAIYAPKVGVPWSNQETFERITTRLTKIEAPGKQALLDFVRLLLIGNRTRYVQCPEFLRLNSFLDHASAFEQAVNNSVEAVASSFQRDAPDCRFDAVIGVSSVGQVLPGIADRARRAFAPWVGRDAVLLDIGNGGCTASVRAIQTAVHLGPEMKNVLVVVTEPTSTMADATSMTRSNWQGICTFGDGAAAAWVSDQSTEGALELSHAASWQGQESDLIRWDYGAHYYQFGIGDPEQFEVKVRSEILEAMTHLPWQRNPEALWAVHPAGIMLLLSIAKKLGIERLALEPSIRHFRCFSNMSGASILHVLKDVVDRATPGQEVRWLSMGAGFHVEYGSGIRV
jgi:predicted naringenin-chalcone synthase